MTISLPPISYPTKPVPPFFKEPPENLFPFKFPTLWRDITGRPYITVSSKGLANGLSEYFNDGADFGPDTPGTATCGIQEAINSLPLQTNEDTANNTGTGPSGSIKLRNGVYTMANSLNIPTFSNVSLIGMNQSVNLGSVSTLSTKDVGGVIIYFPASLTDSATNYPLFNAPIYTDSNIILNIKNITLYIDNPSSFVDATAININGMYNGALKRG